MQQYKNIDKNLGVTVGTVEEIMTAKLKAARDSNVRLRKTIAILVIGLLFAIAGAVISFGFFTKDKIEVMELKNQISSLKDDKNGLNSTVSELEINNRLLYDQNQDIATDYNTTLELLYDVSTMTYQLDNEVKELQKSIKTKNIQLKKFEERKRLLNSYEWAMYSSGKKTDICYKDIKDLQGFVKERKLSDDTVDLVLAIAMTESDGDKNCISTESTARGLGQFLSGTGKFVYTKLMGNKSYNHQRMALDKTINLEMMVEYLKYLDKTQKGNVDKIINRYRGLDSPGYKAKINSYLHKNNKNLGNIKLTN